MELKEFIQTSIREILAGVRAAQDDDMAVAPARIEGKPIWTERLIEFEINVTTDTTAKTGISVMSVVEAGGAVQKSTTNRLCFSVPVHMNVEKREVL